MTKAPSRANSLFGRADVEWGVGEEMSALEATMWRAEADPQLRSSGVVLELLDRAPEWERLVAGHEWALRRAPRLTHRVVDDPLRIGPPAWVATDVDLAYHLRRTHLPPGGDLDSVLEVAQALHMAAFDPARPLWEAVLVEGLTGGRAAYLLKVHHALADGPAFMQLFDLLHSDSAQPTPDKPSPPVGAPDRLGGAELALRHATDGIRGSVGTALRLALGAGEHGARALARPRPAASSAVRFAQSLRRVTAGAPGTPSPLMRERGLARRLGTIDVPLAALRAAGKATGGTVNDAFLAGLAGGLGRYHALHDVAVSNLPIALPVSLRSAGEAADGNRFAGARIAAPAGEPSARERVRIIHERVLAAREEPALDFLGLTAPVASRVPGAALTRLTASFTRSIDLQASNFPGLGRPAYIAGARITRTYPFGPAPGCAVMATLVSHGDTCCIGLTIDHSAVPDPDALVRCFEEGIDEVLALGRGAKAPA
jgi:WS/DGAT/MGAT family acyltransferase